MGKILPNVNLFFLYLVIAVLIGLLDWYKLLALPRQWVYALTNPISFSLYHTKQSASRQLHFIFAARFASQENKALQEQIGQLISENASLRTKLSETEAQLEQQQSLDPRTYQLVSARPIGLVEGLKIDKGSKDGIKPGLAVIFKDNYLGRIKSVSQSQSVVQFLSDPEAKLAVFSVGKEGKAKGLLRGQFGTEMLMDKILHEEVVSVDDLVYSEGTEGFLPRGLIIGRVSEVIEKPNEVFKSAKVKPVFDVRDLELVFIIQE